MTPKELAALLNGRQYREEITPEEIQRAKAADLVVVYGASDDLAEFRGAISDEVGCCEGGETEVDAQGILPEFEDISHKKHHSRDYFAREAKCRKIEAVWNNEGYSWTYKTDIPHETFEILEGDEKYCRGIVFALADLATGEDARG